MHQTKNFFVLVCLFSAFHLHAQQIKVTAPDGGPAEFFGTTSAMSPSARYAAVGATHHGVDYNYQGAVYLYENHRGNWHHTQKLYALDGSVGQNFGSAVALTDDSLFVGANLDDEAGTSRGAVYVFQKTRRGWTQRQKILPPAGNAYDEFGKHISVDGNRMLVGAFGTGYPGDPVGATYVLEKENENWKIITRLDPPIVENRFGFRVALKGDLAAVAAPFSNFAAEGAGAIYFYRRHGKRWRHIGEIIPNSDAHVALNLGRSMEFCGNKRLAVGAPGAKPYGLHSGAVYVFQIEPHPFTFHVEGTLYAPAHEFPRGGRFGYGLSCDDERLVAGAPRTDFGFLDQVGAVHEFLFGNQTWEYSRTLRSTDFEEHDLFGLSVATRRGWIFTGAPLEDETGFEAGAAYFD